MERFQLESPTSLDAAVRLLDGQPQGARPLAGGTAVLPLWKEHLLVVETLVDLGRIAEMRVMRQENHEVRIGAGVTLARAEDSELVRTRLPLLHDAIRQAANRRIREMATLGGALCQGDPASDVSAGALASRAVVHTVRRDGGRVLPLGDFFRGLYETALAPGEIVTHVTCEAFEPAHRYAYVKFSPRSRYDRPTVGVAVSWLERADGCCFDVRVALSSAGETPLRSPGAEAALEGRRPDEEAIQAAADAVHREVDPLTDLRGSAEYKREMARVFLRRAVARARDRGREAAS